MSNTPKSKARKFLKEYRLSQVTLEDLRRIITQQGYTIIAFNHIFNDEPVAKLIDALHLEQMVEKAKGFTYADRQRRLVFVHEDLSDKEKMLVLAHEEGHIYCDHFSADPIVGRDVVEEHEANEFTHYILNPGAAVKFGGCIRKRKKLFGAAAIVLAVAMIGLLVFKLVPQKPDKPNEYYITATGDKYHEAECIFVCGVIIKRLLLLAKLCLVCYTGLNKELIDICLCVLRVSVKNLFTVNISIFKVEVLKEK